MMNITEKKEEEKFDSYRIVKVLTGFAWITQRHRILKTCNSLTIVDLLIVLLLVSSALSFDSYREEDSCKKLCLCLK